LQQIVLVFHPVADREAVVVERAGVQKLRVKFERLIMDAELNIRALRKLRGSGRLVLFDRLAVGFVACTEVETQVQPFGDMEQLIKVERGLRDAQSRTVREDNLLEAMCERSEALFGGAISGLLHRGRFVHLRGFGWGWRGGLYLTCPGWLGPEMDGRE
jgi:hypothetical protein